MGHDHFVVIFSYLGKLWVILDLVDNLSLLFEVSSLLQLIGKLRHNCNGSNDAARRLVT